MIKYIIIILFYVSLISAQTSRWRVVWDSNPIADNILYYEVYIGSDSTNMNLVGTVNHPETEYRDSLGIGGLGLSLGQIYYYKIRGVNAEGAGPFSNVAYASIPEILFDEFTFPSSADTTFGLNQSILVRDPESGISQLEWNVEDLVPGDPIQFSMLNSNTIQFITPDTLAEDLLQFKVFDPDSFFDERLIPIHLELLATPPRIVDIIGIER